MMMADNGVVSEWQSYLGNLAMVKGGGLEKYWTESEVYRCKGGNQQLATKFAAAIGAPRIMTRTPVRSIAMTDKLGARHARQRQGARGRARAADGAAERVEQDRHRPGAAGGAGAADGHEHQVPDVAEVAGLAAHRDGAGTALRRSGVDDVARHRRPEGRRRSA